MSEHADPNQPFDPNAEYLPCCHPRYMPVGSKARDTFDAWEADQQRRLAEWQAAHAPENNQQQQQQPEAE